MSPTQPANPPLLADGGLETSLVFHQGIDLPDFAAFPLLDSEPGRRALHDYFAPYLELARSTGAGFVLDTATWRANLDWGARLGYDPAALADVNRRAVGFAQELAAAWSDVEVEVNGVIGPRGDGYVVGSTMSSAEAARYHGLQASAFAEAGADVVTAVTMTYAEEAAGIALAVQRAGLRSVISFTVETDGRLPSGQDLGAAISQVDEETDGSPAYFMVNCAHPTHFADVLRTGGDWTRRVRAVRANASAASHEELDAADELDRGDVAELATHYVDLFELLPDLRVVGGCCGTDHEHVGAIAGRLLARV